ncbi:creatininase family protein, partial [Holdemanella biformis]
MRLERMSWKDCEEYFKNHDMVILTTGSTENHGIHNPLGTDTMIPNKILELVEKQSDVLIAPTLPYGDADFHTEYTGTISIGSDLLEMVMERISDRLYDCG